MWENGPRIFRLKTDLLCCQLNFVVQFTTCLGKYRSVDAIATTSTTANVGAILRPVEGLSEKIRCPNYISARPNAHTTPSAKYSAASNPRHSRFRGIIEQSNSNPTANYGGWKQRTPLKNNVAQTASNLSPTLRERLDSTFVASCADSGTKTHSDPPPTNPPTHPSSEWKSTQ